MNIDFENRLKPLIEEARARGVTDVDMEVAMILPARSINRQWLFILFLHLFTPVSQ